MAEIQMDPFKTENFYYNEEHDFCICPMGQRMRRIGTRNVKPHPDMSAKMHGTELSGVKAVPWRCRCFKAKGNRTIGTES